jgi:predicted nucleotidyltransferase
MEAGKSLDRHYIPTRYPNSHPSGAPGDLYTERDARPALADAKLVLEHVTGRDTTLDHPAVMRALRAYGSGRPEVREVVLIGSLARGDWSACSDADVVVTVDEAVERFQDRSPAYPPSRSLGVPVDVFVYAHEERVGWGDRFEREVERGVVLYRRL